jgi:hypothetical protein
MTDEKTGNTNSGKKTGNSNNDNKTGNDDSRSPSGMTTRKANATAKAKVSVLGRVASKEIGWWGDAAEFCRGL